MIKRDAIAIATTGILIMGSALSTAQTTAPAPMVPIPSPVGQQPVLPGQPVATPAVVPVIPVAPGTTPAAATTDITLSTAGTLPVLPQAGVVPVSPFGALPGTTAAAAPTPPPIGNLDPETAEASSGTTATVASSAAPSQLYAFLFIEDPEYGIVRHKFTTDVADRLKEHEIQKLLEKRRNMQGGNALGGGIGVMDPAMAGMMVDPAMMDPTMYDPAMGAAVDPALYAAGAGYAPGATGTAAGNTVASDALRAAAEWDFYYSQLEMYDRYVREKLIPNAIPEDLPELAYNATNALQERQDLFESFQEQSITQNNDDFNENKEFYERLQKREDRRTAFRQWLLHKQNEVAEWADVWARNVFGTRWADGEEVRVDDWYYGTDFNSAQPVLVAIDDREYVVSRQPAGRLQEGQLNVISSNLTPYDIIDNNGYLKNPVMETQRGTLVIPPAGPVYTTDTTTGTIEIVGGSTE